MELHSPQDIEKSQSLLTCIVACATSSGRTTLLFDILSHGHEIFTIPPQKIIYCYGVWQGLFESIKKEISFVEFFQGFPAREDLDMWNLPGHKLLILDDLLEKAAKNSDIVELFCQDSHHLNYFVFFVVQNLFAHGKYFRIISLNTQYFILLKQNRDQSQLLALAKQAFPGKVTYFIDAYRKATQRPFGYLLVDLHPKTLYYKLRTNIIPGQIMSVFLPETVSEAKINSLIKKEIPFLKLFVSTSLAQQKTLIKTISKSQIRAVVQIVYNILKGNRDLSERNKKKLRRHKTIIRRFVSKTLSHENRIRIFFKYLQDILLVIKPVIADL